MMFVRFSWRYSLRRWILWLTGLLFLTTILSFAMAKLWLPGIGHWLAQSPHVAQADAIVVLGGTSQRIQQGIILYKQNLAPEVWHTGDVASCPSAQRAAQLAIERGVPAEAIHLLATTNTWEDGQEIAALAKERRLQSILVVTDWPHSRRALCVIKQQLADSGIAIYYAPPTDSPYGPENWWQHRASRAVVLKELIKIGFYWMRYGVAPWSCKL